MKKEIGNSRSQYQVPRATACIWGPAWLTELADHRTKATEYTPTADPTRTIPADLTSRSTPSEFPLERPPLTPEFFQYSDWCWTQISTEAFGYLTGPRAPVWPCMWCKGRLSHHRLCDALRRSWEPTIPFGKYKGKPLIDVPLDYLIWLNSNVVLVAELKDAVQGQIRKHGYWN